MKLIDLIAKLQDAIVVATPDARVLIDGKDIDTVIIDMESGDVYIDA